MSSEHFDFFANLNVDELVEQPRQRAGGTWQGDPRPRVLFPAYFLRYQRQPAHVD